MQNYKAIFKEYDIRGVYKEQFDESTALLLGKAFGSHLKRHNISTAVVGMDNRESSPSLQSSLITGILSTGTNVVDIGTVITPMLYYATIKLGFGSGIIVTASHNPATYNGFKIQFAGRTMFGKELQSLKDRMITGDFEVGAGELQSYDIKKDYLQMLQEKILLQRKLKVVIDCGNGTASLIAPEVFEKLGCEVIPLFCDSDPSFPNHFPDPTQEKNMYALQAKVKEVGADVGIAFDGDGDRLGAVDENGKIIWGDTLMILFWREIMPNHPGAEAIIEVKCSNLLVKEVLRLGGRPFFYKTGHSLIKAKMGEIGAVFTGEMSGHMFFADEYYGFDDAIYAAARLLRILSKTDTSFSQLLADLPPTFITPEIRVPCADEKKASFVQKAKETLTPMASTIIDVDGVRAEFTDGWGLVRASNTGPELIVRCEGNSKEAKERILGLIQQAILPLAVLN